jgi:hypothetical protein
MEVRASTARKQKIQPPWVVLPTESLYLGLGVGREVDEGVSAAAKEREQETAFINQAFTSLPPMMMKVGGGANLVSSGVLDEETGKRILQYIYQEGTGSVIQSSNIQKEKRSNKRRDKTQRDENGQPTLMYIPESVTNAGKKNKGNSEPDLLARAADSLGLVSTRNIQQITKQLLRKNNITVRVLLEDLEVPLTELKAAGILNTFQDLVDLEFETRDLVRGDRTLFNSAKLRQLFDADFAKIRGAGVAFDLRHLMRCGFSSAELMALDFSFHTLVGERGITWRQLADLNFKLEDLMMLDLRREDIQALEISEAIAVTPRPNGLGWPRDLWHTLAGKPTPPPQVESKQRKNKK